MTLYGSPVWARELTANRRSKNLLRRVERKLAVRVAHAYRTTSHAAATALAGLIPFDLLAEVDAHVYGRHRQLRQ
ncbi:hypothetical protein WH47_07106 [Habropoda laboriosa]|uniref:Uncharacterized protein n=1 Tax=Habropoda laboriosa TaxID=597456 RepID=A0A0L7QRF6_9HYME|nr:hypothetical protein WH47_07106 [Habropoda laboriosa]